MPVTKFICPDGIETDKDVCISGICRMHKRCAPIPFLKQAGLVRPFDGKPSTTQLLNGTREEFLKLTKPISIKPFSKAFAILGTGAHSALDTNDDWSFNEERLSDSIASGQFDRIEKQEDGSWWLIENKTYGSYKVNKALGLVAQKKPAFYPNGDPVLYVKSGKGFKAGDQKQETFYLQEGKPDMDDLILQQNRNRMLVEGSLKTKISEMKCFIIVRDGNTVTAKDRGILETCYYIDVPFMLDEKVDLYFSTKAKALTDALSTGTLPPLCSPSECWEGMKCKNFCDVAEFCVR
jgi:hypothetical protein